jgi:hypothetical protein
MMNTPMNLNPRDCPNDHSGVNHRAKYFVEDYCKNCPDDRGNERIYPEDVVRPRNHKWADQKWNKCHGNRAVKKKLNKAASIT